MTEQPNTTPVEATQPDLPGFSKPALKLTREQRSRVIERALKDKISDAEALNKIQEEDSIEAELDRKSSHAP